MKSGIGKLTWIANCICILHKFVLYAVSWEWSKEHLVLQWKQEHLMSSHDQCHKCALISDPEIVQNRKYCLYIIFVLSLHNVSCFKLLHYNLRLNSLSRRFPLQSPNCILTQNIDGEKSSCPCFSSTSYNNIGWASFRIQKPVKTESTKAGDLGRMRTKVRVLKRVRINLLQPF